MSLKKAVIWNGLSQVGQSGIQFIATIILARLLTPDDFGILGMITIFISFSQMVVDSEMGGALLRKKDVTAVDFSTLFIYNLVVSVVLYLALFAVAPLIATFYDKPTLIPAIRVLAFTVLIHSFRVVQRVIILRNLQFKVMANINIISGLISLSVAIVMAKMGYGFWALVAQQISLILVGVILMCLYNRYIPTLHFSVASFKEQFSFAAGLLGADLLRTVANNINTNIIAKIMPLAQVGYFVQSSRLANFGVTFTQSIVDQSVFPIIAKLESEDEIKTIYKRFYTLITSLLILFSAWLVLFSPNVIELLLGEKWLPASWMLQLLALIIVPNMIQTLCKNLLKVRAKTTRVLKIQSVQSFMILALLTITCFMGIYAIVAGFVVAQFLSAIYTMVIVSKNIDYPIVSQLRDMLLPIFVGTASALAVYFVGSQLIISSAIVSLSIMTLIFVGVTIMLYLIFKREVVVAIFNRVRL